LISIWMDPPWHQDAPRHHWRGINQENSNFSHNYSCRGADAMQPGCGKKEKTQLQAHSHNTLLKRGLHEKTLWPTN